MEANGMNRQDHLQWAKDRALAYLPADPVNAMASMISDLRKHPELAGHIGISILPIAYGRHDDPAEVRKWIEGFN
jgi:hypothetical protein